MLTLQIAAEENFDEEQGKFVYLGGVTIQLEHSLVSLSKWEEIWEKPFLETLEKTADETFSYFQCMSLNGDIPMDVLGKLTEEQVSQIGTYVQAKRSATWFVDRKAPPGKKETITSEVIYYWMVAHTIPFEAQNWHLNRLLTLIRVCNEKNKTTEKKGPMKSDELANRRALNEQRRAQNNSKG